MSQAVAERNDATVSSLTDRAPRAPKAVATPSAMLAQAVATGAPIEVVTQLMGLLKETRAEERKMAFDAALSAAKAEIPPILKNRVVDFTSAKGRTNYRHEDLGEIAKTVDPILTNHGLSYRFRTEQEGNNVKVTCIVAHRDGYAEENSISASRDESGNKNSIQAVGSTITYLQRYTLKASLGLAVSNDDDGRGRTPQPPVETVLISSEQRDELLGLIEETATDVALFCRFYRIEAVPDLPASKFGSAKAKLVAKKAA